MIGWLFLLLTSGAHADSSKIIRLHAGYVTRIQCEGRLLLSAVGSEGLVRLEAVPKELGCAVLLKPVARAGRTNLILETSAGTIERIVEVHAGEPSPGALSISLKGDSQ